MTKTKPTDYPARKPFMTPGDDLSKVGKGPSTTLKKMNGSGSEVDTKNFMHRQDTAPGGSTTPSLGRVITPRTKF